MHESLEALHGKLHDLLQALTDHVPSEEPFGKSTGNWNAPAISRVDIQDDIQEIIDLIDASNEDAPEHPDVIAEFAGNVEWTIANTMPNFASNYAASVHPLMITLSVIRRAIIRELKIDPRRELASDLRTVRERIRSTGAAMNSLGPTVDELKEMVSRIEGAYAAADRLPTELENLAEARARISTLANSAAEEHGRLQKSGENVLKLEQKLAATSTEAAAVMDKCHYAFAAATSVGLAKAFSERSDALTRAMLAWVGGLIVSLTVAGVLGYTRLESLSRLIEGGNAQTGPLTLSVILSVLSVGAPVWFAWLATKQVGQQFKLAEDYAFKASISRAYEGYRTEAARVDADLEAQLLESALGRLDEEPLRLVEPGSHSSPLHEALNSEFVREAFKVVPNFADRLKGFAASAVAGAATAAAAVKPSKADDVEDEEEATQG